MVSKVDPNQAPYQSVTPPTSQTSVMAQNVIDTFTVSRPLTGNSPQPPVLDYAWQPSSGDIRGTSGAGSCLPRPVTDDPGQQAPADSTAGQLPEIILEKYPDLVRKGPLGELQFTDKYRALNEDSKKAVIDDITALSQTLIPDDLKAKMPAKQASLQLLGLFRMNDEYYHQVRVKACSDKIAGAQEEKGPKAEKEVDRLQAELDKIEDDYQTRRKTDEIITDLLINDPEVSSIKEAFAKVPDANRTNDWRGCYQIFSDDLRSNQMGIIGTLSKAHNFGNIVWGSHYADEDISHFADSDNFSSEDIQKGYINTLALYAEYGYQEQAKEMILADLNNCYDDAYLRIGAEEFGITQNTQQFIKKKELITAELGIPATEITDAMVITECAKDNIRPQVIRDKFEEFHDIALENRDGIAASLAKARPELVQDKSGFERAVDMKVMECTSEMVEKETQETLRSLADKRMPETLDRMGTDKQKDVWAYYNDTFDPRNEWLNLSTDKKKQIFTEFCINAPLIVMSGGLASIARAGINGAARSMIARYALQAGRIGLTIGKTAEGASRVVATSKLGTSLYYSGLLGGLAAEGTIFHAASSALSVPLVGVDAAFSDFGKGVMWSTITLGTLRVVGMGMGKLKLTPANVPAGAATAAKRTADAAAGIGAETLAFTGLAFAQEGKIPSGEEFLDQLGNSLLTVISLKASGAVAGPTVKRIEKAVENAGKSSKAADTIRVPQVIVDNGTPLQEGRLQHLQEPIQGLTDMLNGNKPFTDIRIIEDPADMEALKTSVGASTEGFTFGENGYEAVRIGNRIAISRQCYEQIERFRNGEPGGMPGSAVTMDPLWNIIMHETMADYSERNMGVTGKLPMETEGRLKDYESQEKYDLRWEGHKEDSLYDAAMSGNKSFKTSTKERILSSLQSPDSPLANELLRGSRTWGLSRSISNNINHGQEVKLVFTEKGIFYDNNGNVTLIPDTADLSWAVVGIRATQFITISPSRYKTVDAQAVQKDLESFLITGRIKADGSFTISPAMSVTSSQMASSFRVLGNWLNTGKTEDFGQYYHYTDPSGYDRIISSGMFLTKSYADRSARICFTDRLMDPYDVVNTLFAPNPRGYSDRGDYMLSFALREGIPVEHPAESEFWVRSNLKFGKDVDLTYSGPNPYYFQRLLGFLGDN